MWLAVEETTGIFEKFCIDGAAGVALQLQKWPSSPFISDPRALLSFPRRHAASSGWNLDS
jgi:hypothetical protein